MLHSVYQRWWWTHKMLEYIRSWLIVGLCAWDKPRYVTVITMEHLYIYVYAYLSLCRTRIPRRKPRKARMIGGRRTKCRRYKIKHTYGSGQGNRKVRHCEHKSNHYGLLLLDTLADHGPMRFVLVRPPILVQEAK